MARRAGWTGGAEGKKALEDVVDEGAICCTEEAEAERSVTTGGLGPASLTGDGVEGAGVGRSNTGLSRSTSGKKTSRFSSTVSTAGRIAQSLSSSSRARKEFRLSMPPFGECEPICPKAMSESCCRLEAVARILSARSARRDDMNEARSPGSPAAAARRRLPDEEEGGEGFDDVLPSPARAPVVEEECDSGGVGGVSILRRRLGRLRRSAVGERDEGSSRRETPTMGDVGEVTVLVLVTTLVEMEGAG